MNDPKQGKTLGEIAQRVVVAEVVNEGTRLVLPENCTIDEGIDLLTRRKKYESETVSVTETFDAFPMDGAHALDRVLSMRYGWTEVGATPGFWGPTPPTLLSIEVARGVFRNVPIGIFTLPGVDGKLQAHAMEKHGRTVFALTATITRLHEAEVVSLFGDIRAYLRTGSIYRGKALRVRFKDDDGDELKMPEITFIDTDVDESMLIYSEHVQTAIETNLFTPIRRHRDLEAHGIPFKRGVLLGGAFGTGKTLAAKVASKLAVEQNITYVYVPRADELKHAIAFAKLYQEPGAVVFCEDIDRVMSGDRDVSMDDILNIVDGIDTKTCRIMIVMTTNALPEINQAMLRPGRLDAVIEVTAPDAHAVQKLLRAYGGERIAASEDLSEAGQELAGQIPATIAEVVRRATLSQLSLQQPGERVTKISGTALADAARTMSRQLALLNHKDQEEGPTLGSLLEETVANAVADGFGERVATLERMVSEVHTQIID